MPNMVNSIITIELTDRGNISQKQTRWEIFRDLRHSLDTCANEPVDCHVFGILRPMPISSDPARREITWRCDNWGTKWEPDIHHYEFDKNYKSVSMAISTAWCAPIKLLKYLTEMGFDISCTFASVENETFGFYENGECNGYQIDYFDETDFQDMHDILQDLDEGEQLHRMMTIGLGTDDEFIMDEFYSVYERMHEEYQDWAFAEDLTIDRKSENLRLKNKVMEWLEDDLQNNNMKENNYLKICNGLKDSQYEQTKKGFDCLLDTKFSMINCYKGKAEPNLQLIYC